MNNNEFKFDPNTGQPINNNVTSQNITNNANIQPQNITSQINTNQGQSAQQNLSVNSTQ